MGAHINLNKPFFRRLEAGKKPSEYLIIDCVEEYFPIIKVGEAIFDANDEYQYKEYLLEKGGVEQSKYDYILENSEKYEEKIHAFCNGVLSYYSPRKIIINKVFFKHEYKKDGIIKSMTGDKVLQYKRINFVLSWVYEKLGKYLPDSIIFEQSMGVLLEANHPWNASGQLSGIHFELDFYDDFYKKLRAKIKRDEEDEMSRNASRLALQIKEAGATIEKLNASLQEKERMLNEALAKNHNYRQISVRIPELELQLKTREASLAQKEKEFQGALAKIQNYHRMSKDSAISLYRKIRRTLGIWSYS
jgi:hypothetical protein